MRIGWLIHPSAIFQREVRANAREGVIVYVVVPAVEDRVDDLIVNICQLGWIIGTASNAGGVVGDCRCSELSSSIEFQSHT